MTKNELKQMLDGHEDIEFKGKCHDCGKEISVIAGSNGTQGGAVYKINEPSVRRDGIFVKCQECFDKDNVLRNWRPCEVYSRVVGYLRPVQQWNKGKRQEFEERVPYALNKITTGTT